MFDFKGIMFARKSSESAGTSRVKADIETELAKHPPFHKLIWTERGRRFVSFRTQTVFKHVVVRLEFGRWYVEPDNNQTYESLQDMLTKHTAFQQKVKRILPPPKVMKDALTGIKRFYLGQKIIHVPTGRPAILRATLADGKYGIAFGVDSNTGVNALITVDPENIQAFGVGRVLAPIGAFKRNDAVMHLTSKRQAEIIAVHRDGQYSIRFPTSARPQKVPAHEIRLLELAERNTAARAAAGASGWQNESIYHNNAFVMAMWDNGHYYLATVLSFDRARNAYRIKWEDGKKEEYKTVVQLRPLTRKEKAESLKDTYECERCQTFENSDLNTVNIHERNCGLERIETEEKGYGIITNNKIQLRARIGDEYPGIRKTVRELEAKKAAFKLTEAGDDLWRQGKHEFEAKTTEYIIQAGEDDEEDDGNSYVLDPTDAHFELLPQPDISMTYLNEPNEDELPNVKFVELTENEKHTGVGIFAIRRISPGEELLVDYGAHYDRSRYDQLRFECRGCGKLGTNDEIDIHELTCVNKTAFDDWGII
jgi:hypothetical protein